MTTQTLHADLGAALAEHYVAGATARAKGRGPAARNQASAIGWPCPSGPRYLVLLRTVQPEPTTPELQMIFEEGDAQEEVVARQLVRDGWALIDSEKPNKVWPDLQISGRIDREGTVPEAVANLLGLDPRTRYVVEIKSMAGPSWDKATSIEAMMSARQPWLRGYAGQLLMYLWLEERTSGVFVLKNKQTGQLRFLPMHMDDWVGLAADLVERCKQSNAYIAAGILPEATGYEDEVCRRCRVRNACLPGEAGIGADVILDEEMEMALQRRDELAPAAKDYERFDAWIKAQMKALAGENAGIWVCKDWTLEVKQSVQHYKAQPETDRAITRISIRRAKGDANEPAADE